MAKIEDEASPPWKQTTKADQRVGGESKEIFFFYQFIHS